MTSWTPYVKFTAAVAAVMLIIWIGWLVASGVTPAAMDECEQAFSEGLATGLAIGNVPLGVAMGETRRQVCESAKGGEG